MYVIKLRNGYMKFVGIHDHQTNFTKKHQVAIKYKTFEEAETERLRILEDLRIYKARVLDSKNLFLDLVRRDCVKEYLGVTDDSAFVGMKFYNRILDKYTFFKGLIPDDLNFIEVYFGGVIWNYLTARATAGKSTPIERVKYYLNRAIDFYTKESKLYDIFESAKVVELKKTDEINFGRVYPSKKPKWKKPNINNSITCNNCGVELGEEYSYLRLKASNVSFFLCPFCIERIAEESKRLTPDDEEVRQAYTEKCFVHHI